jgi:hypothetical protein
MHCPFSRISWTAKRGEPEMAMAKDGQDRGEGRLEAVPNPGMRADSPPNSQPAHYAGIILDSSGLLQLKFVARDQPQTPARELFDEAMVAVMARYLHHPAQTLTTGEFWQGIGRLGGHPGRKGDGPIGWLRAWRGWQSFQLIMLGAHLSSPHGVRECG